MKQPLIRLALPPAPQASQRSFEHAGLTWLVFRDPRQEHRLREHEQGGDDAEERVGHQERSHRPRATEQARIEGGDLRHGRP